VVGERSRSSAQKEMMYYQDGTCLIYRIFVLAADNAWYMSNISDFLYILVVDDEWMFNSSVLDVIFSMFS
jgi:hypothetical protein